MIVHISMFCRKSLIVLFHILASLVTMIGVSAAQSKQATAKPGMSVVNSVKQSRITQGGGHQPGLFNPNPVIVLLAENYHALGVAPQTDIAANIKGASLPAASGKKYGALGLSRTRFLSPPKSRPASLRDLKIDALPAKPQISLPSIPGNDR